MLNRVQELEGITRTNIMLILKVTSPNTMSQFRPISLCIVIYKINAKAIANKLRKVLDIYINETQGAFIPQRQISDNVLIAYELLHAFKKRHSATTISFALKLDTSKAYDRVE